MIPIHPALVHFPIALVTFSVIADLAGYWSHTDGLRRAANWAMIGALIGAAIAVPAGYFDMVRQNLGPEVHEEVHTHMYVGIGLLTSILILAIWRWSLRGRMERGRWGYYVVAIAVLGLTFFQGWLGHDLVVEDGVGVAAAREHATGEATAAAESGDQRDRDTATP